jgi:hypothetical protein
MSVGWMLVCDVDQHGKKEGRNWLSDRGEGNGWTIRTFSSSQATTLTFLICLPKSNISAFLSLRKSIPQRCIHRFCKAHGLDPAHKRSRQFLVGFSVDFQMAYKNERMALFQWGWELRRPNESKRRKTRIDHNSATFHESLYSIKYGSSVGTTVIDSVAN